MIVYCKLKVHAWRGNYISHILSLVALRDRGKISITESTCCIGETIPGGVFQTKEYLMDWL